MIRRNKCCAALCLALLALTLLFSACGAGVPEEAILAFDAGEDGGEYYFYGVEKSGGTYYVRVLSEYAEEPAEADFRYIPLAEELDASFQEDGWVGAWSPAQYLSAKELFKAAGDGKITQGAYFTCLTEDGCANYLAEHNDYADNPIDLTTGELKQ